MSRGPLAMLVFTAWIGITTVITAVPDSIQAEEGIPEIRQLHGQGEIRSLEKVVERARRRYPEARLIEAELLREDDRLIYEVELIDSDGVVREQFFDARTGDRVTEFEEESGTH
ncbi:MAG: PepSY domain-containing protein [Thiohalorhabdaceae bacterium]